MAHRRKRPSTTPPRPGPRRPTARPNSQGAKHPSDDRTGGRGEGSSPRQSHERTHPCNARQSLPSTVLILQQRLQPPELNVFRVHDGMCYKPSHPRRDDPSQIHPTASIRSSGERGRGHQNRQRGARSRRQGGNTPQPHARGTKPTPQQTHHSTQHSSKQGTPAPGPPPHGDTTPNETQPRGGQATHHQHNHTATPTPPPGRQAPHQEAHQGGGRAQGKAPTQRTHQQGEHPPSESHRTRKSTRPPTPWQNRESKTTSSQRARQKRAVSSRTAQAEPAPTSEPTPQKAQETHPADAGKQANSLAHVRPRRNPSTSKRR